MGDEVDDDGDKNDGEGIEGVGEEPVFEGQVTVFVLGRFHGVIVAKKRTAASGDLVFLLLRKKEAT